MRIDIQHWSSIDNNHCKWVAEAQNKLSKKSYSAGGIEETYGLDISFGLLVPKGSNVKRCLLRHVRLLDPVLCSLGDVRDDPPPSELLCSLILYSSHSRL